jgi:hypothetical protein
MPHSAEQEDMPWHYFQHAAGRGERIAASILLRSGTGSELSNSQRQPPLHWLRALQVRPSANRSAASCCSLHVRVVDCSHGDRFGKSAAESTELCSMSRRQAAARPAACFALLPVRGTGTATPNPKCGFAASASLAHRNAISLPCCSIRHAGALALQPPAAPGSTPALANAQGTPGT